MLAPIMLMALALGFLGAGIYLALGGKRFSGPDFEPVFGREILIRPHRWDSIVRTPDIVEALRKQDGRVGIPKVSSWDPSEMTVEIFRKSAR